MCMYMYVYIVHIYIIIHNVCMYMYVYIVHIYTHNYVDTPDFLITCGLDYQNIQLYPHQYGVLMEKEVEDTEVDQC